MKKLTAEQKKYVEEISKLQADLRRRFHESEEQIEQLTREAFLPFCSFGDLLLTTHHEMMFTPEEYPPPASVSEGARRFLSARALSTAWQAYRSLLYGYYLDGMALTRVLVDNLMYLRVWRKHPTKAEHLFSGRGKARRSLGKARNLAGLRELFRDYDLMSSAIHSGMDALMDLADHNAKTIRVGPYWNPESAEYGLGRFVATYRNTVAELALDHPDLQAVMGGRVRNVLTNIGSTLENMELVERVRAD